MFPAYKHFRFDKGVKLIKGHKGNVNDCAFSPFNDELLATASEDGSIKLWLVPETGITEHLTQADADLIGHTKKVLGVAWHRSVENMIASHSGDLTLRIWDVENQTDTMIFEPLPNLATAMRWSPHGNLLATTCKGGSLIVHDPRHADAAMKTTAHNGPKAQKLAWIDNDSFITSGFSKTAEREYAAWDARNLEAPVAKGMLGDGLGVAHLNFDENHKILYVAGRGETQIGMYTYNVGQPNALHFLDKYAASSPNKGFHMMPKQCLDVNMHEVDRAVRLSNTGVIEYVSFVLPNRTGAFQEDLYPEFHSNKAASNFAEFAAGTDKPANMMQLKQESAGQCQQKKANFMARLKKEDAPVVQQAPSSDESAAEIAKLRAEIEVLKASQNVPSHGLNLKSKPTLGYWNIRGLGAQIRYLLLVADVDFEDKLYDVGPAPEFSRDSWLDVKFTLGLDYPNLPYMIDEDMKITETVAIMKYVCGKWKPELLGKNPAEMAVAEMMSAHVGTLKGKATMPCYTTGDRPACQEDCTPVLENIMKFIGNKPWIAGEGITYLDFAFWELLELLDVIFECNLNDKFPGVKEYRERFMAEPSFAKAWANEKICMREPFNNDMALIASRTNPN